MTKYLLAYHGGGMPESEDAQAQTMQAWGAWFQKLGASVIDGGAPTGASLTVNPNGSSDTGGGANPVSGYNLIDAANLEEAAEKAKGCPILASGGTIEVCETFDPGA
ncbi:MAG: hypothetical protein O3A63_04345 [Proteobacteria bacterium]|nr:hypothetical protein [Pseudomonadota bacterium]